MRDKNIVSFRGSWRERKFKNTNKKNKREQRKCYFILKRATGETRRVSRFGRGAPRRAAKLTLNFRARQKIPKSDSDRFWRFFNSRARGKLKVAKNEREKKS